MCWPSPPSACRAGQRQGRRHAVGWADGRAAPAASAAAQLPPRRRTRRAAWTTPEAAAGLGGGGGGGGGGAAAADEEKAPVPAKRGRRPAAAAAGPPEEDDALRRLLLGTGLPPRAAAKLLAAQRHELGASRVPADPVVLAQRVRRLQELLGPDGAARAVQRFPQITTCSPDRLSLHLRQWLGFFAEGSGGGSEAEVRRQELLGRLAASPQLLAVDVERLVGNLYEVAAMMQAPDLHGYAYKAMALALTRPSALQEKMARVLAFLNAEARQQAGASGGGGSRFTLQQLQGAGRRDHRWLLLSTDTLLKRLAGLQQAFQVPMASVGRMFMLQPSLLHRRSEPLAERIAALRQLPGLDPELAVGAAVAFPALLNLRPDVLAGRWQQLQEAAATSPAWGKQLAQLTPTGLAALLVRSQARYDRLRRVADCGGQEGLSLHNLMCMSDQALDARLMALGQAREQQLQQQQQHRRRQRDGGKGLAQAAAADAAAAPQGRAAGCQAAEV